MSIIIARSLKALKKKLAPIESKKKIGLVPTMGCLHDGHLELVKRSQKLNHYTVVSIFINPMQFNNKDDLKKYPSQEKKEKELLKKYKADVVFIPKASQIYPNGYSTFLHEENYSNILCGKYRKSHFEGVATIVNKLLDLIEPAKIYFGEKDFQQLRIIENLIKKRHPQINLIRCETIRHKNGLALSSRNKKLNNSSLKIATNLYKALNFVKQNIHTVGLKNVKKQALKYLSQFPEIKIEYLEIADEETLTTVENCVNGKKYRVFIAAYIFEVRLIDNIKLY